MSFINSSNINSTVQQENSCVVAISTFSNVGLDTDAEETETE